MTLLVQGAMAWLGPGELVDDPAVVLQGSRIAYAGPAAGAPEADEEVTGDWFLMPGVVDHHVHIGLSDPAKVLLGGVTAVRDLAWPPEVIFPMVDISTSTDYEGPHVSATGPMITATGGYPTRARWAPPGTGLEVRGPEEAAAAVHRVADQDPAAIKIALNADAGPTLSDAELLAVCDTAHERDLTVTSHVQGKGQTERALGAGVDELAHCPWTERLSEHMIERLARSVAIVSTLDIHSYGQITPELRTAVANLFDFIRAGGTVRYGTDLGNGPIPPGIHVREVQHLAAARLPAESILGSMTGSPLHAETPADLIGLAGNPLDDLEALAEVRLVVRAGIVRRLDDAG